MSDLAQEAEVRIERPKDHFENVLSFESARNSKAAQSSDLKPNKRPGYSSMNMAIFAMRMMKDDINGAGKALATVFDIMDHHGHNAATFFHTKLQNEPMIYNKVMDIKSALRNGDSQLALDLIEHCFGITGSMLSHWHYVLTQIASAQVD